MTRGLRRAPGRMSRHLDRWFALPFGAQFAIAGIVVVLAAGLLWAALHSRHGDQPAEPSVPVPSAPPSSMPKAIR